MLLLLLQMASAEPIAIDEHTNTALLSAEKDAICTEKKAPGSPRPSLRIPLQATGHWVVLDTVMQGPNNMGPRALTGHLRFEDGEALELHGWIGQQVSPFLSTGEDSQAIGIEHADGHLLHGQRWTIATGRPDVRVEELVLDLRLPNHTLCLTGISVESSDPPQQTDTTDWYTWALQRNVSAPPQSHPVVGPANRPIHRGEDGHFRYPDGERARFWGVNLTGRSAIPPQDEAKEVAQQLARLGFNAVRIHHIDSTHGQLVNPKRHLPNEPDLLPDRLDDLDYFVSALKEAGIYLFLEVATLRELSPKDGLPPAGSLPGGHKLASMFRPLWTQAYLDAFESLWGRINPYTGVSYAEEPAVALLELSNEHSLLANWGGGIEGLHKNHLLILDQLWNRWLQQKYPSETALRKAWAGSPSHGGLLAGESFDSENVRREPLHPGLRHAYPHRRLLDLNAFYSELEAQFYDAVSEKALSMGFSQPVVASMSFGRPQLQHIYGKWDAADLHLEWDQTRNRRLLSNDSALQNPRDHRLLESAAFAVEDQAFVVTELNHPFPNRYMAEAPLLWATLASVQDWDAIIWFEWLVDSSADRDNFVHSQFDLSHATVKSAQMPTASSLFRSGAIAPASGKMTIHRPLESAILQTLLGKTALPWNMGRPDFWLTHRIRTALGDAPVSDIEGTPAEHLHWDEARGVLTVDLPSTQAVIGPDSAVLSSLRTYLEDWAAVSLTSHDLLPLGESTSALLTIATRQENTGMAWDLAYSVVRAWGVAPILIAPARGRISFRWPERPLVTVLGSDGEAIGTLPVKRERGGWWRLEIDASVRSPWLQITSP